MSRPFFPIEKLEMLNLEAYRILIADQESLLSQQLKIFLESKGFIVQHVRGAEEMRRKVLDWKPHFLVIDMMFPEMNGLSTVKWVRSHKDVRDQVKVVITSNHNMVANVKSCISAGAVDYWVKPIDVENVASRIVFQLSRKNIGSIDEGAPQNLNDPLEGAELQMYLVDLLMRECQKVRASEESVFNMVKMLALNLNSVRVSVVACDQEQQLGWVVSSSDDSNVRGLKINLGRYPEINHVLYTEKMAVIENLDYDPRLQQIKNNVKSISFNSMIICPVFCRGNMFGAMSVRMGLDHKSFDDLQIRFTRVVSLAVGLVLERDKREPKDFAKEEDKKVS